MSFSSVWINYSVMVMLDRIIGKLPREGWRWRRWPAGWRWFPQGNTFYTIFHHPHQKDQRHYGVYFIHTCSLAGTEVWIVRVAKGWRNVHRPQRPDRGNNWWRRWEQWRMMTIPGAQEDHGQWWSGVPEQPKQAPWLIKTAGEVEDDLMIMII